MKLGANSDHPFLFNLTWINHYPLSWTKSGHIWSRVYSFSWTERCLSSTGHSWPIRPGGGASGGAERVASPLFKWISIMPPRLSRRPSITPQLWLAHRRPTCSGQWKLLYLRPFTDNNEAELLMGTVHPKVSSSHCSQSSLDMTSSLSWAKGWTSGTKEQRCLNKKNKKFSFITKEGTSWRIQNKKLFCLDHFFFPNWFWRVLMVRSFDVKEAGVKKP